MTLKLALSEWDEQSVQNLEQIYQHFHSTPHFMSHILDCLTDQKLQKAATWLLKHRIESGSTLDLNQTHQLFGLIDQLAHWEAKLHLLQCLSDLSIHEADRKIVERFLRQALIDHNKFIRAWAYHGFFVLSQQYPQYQEELDRFFQMALKDEAPSVQARIRKLAKQNSKF